MARQPSTCKEAMPVLASYCDALGIRLFAEWRDLQADLADTAFNAIAELVDKPLVNLESALSHPCQALADWKTLDELGVAANSKFVLSWVYHPRALPLAVPATAVHMAAMRGTEVVVLRPQGYELPEPVLRKAQRAAALSGGSVRETEDRSEALAGAQILYAKEWGSTRHYGDSARDAQLRAALTEWCVNEAWFARTARSCRLMHCLPVRRNTAIADEVLDGPRSAVLHAGPQSYECADGGAVSAAQGAMTDMILNRNDQALAIRALRSAAPYIRMYKGKTFVVKAGGGVFAAAELTRALIEQIGILHYFGVRVVMVHGGGPQLTEVADALGVATRMVQGRRVTDEKAIEVSAMVLNGLINTRILGICRDLDIGAVGISGVDAGLIRAQRRPPVKLDDGSGETVDYGLVGDIELVDGNVIRKLLDDGLMPVVSPLSADEHGQLLNINADTVAAALGAALGAEKVILCTGAPGILERADDPGSLISYTDLARTEAAPRGRLPAGGHAAQGQGDRGCAPRRGAARACGLV